MIIKKPILKQQNSLKELAAKKALQYVQEDMVIGIGTGSTVDFFIKELNTIRSKIDLIVPSSNRTKEKLDQIGIFNVNLNYVNSIDIYFDSADEATIDGNLIKGGGGALTGEKICCSCSKEFVCIIDESKISKSLGLSSALPIEVIPMARSYVAKKIISMGGKPFYREDTVTDNGNIILDTYNLNMDDPLNLEQSINRITGVVDNGIFSKFKPSKLIIANKNKEAQTIEFKNK